jgi:hypothetical protein
MKSSPNIGLNIPEGNDIFDYKKFLEDNFNRIDENIISIPLAEELIAVEGQTVFNLVGSYEVGKNAISVEIDGVPQEIGQGFTESSSTSITLAESVPAGAKISVTNFKTPTGVNTKIAELTSSMADNATSPEKFTGTDAQKVQQAIDYAITNNVKSH